MSTGSPNRTSFALWGSPTMYGHAILTARSFFVPGDGGQLLAVFPDLNMVVVFTAGNYGQDDKSVCFKMIRQSIIPAVLSNPPLMKDKTAEVQAVIENRVRPQSPAPRRKGEL
jgi:CubicO group peptidase (beta-lactamase class C family)